MTDSAIQPRKALHAYLSDDAHHQWHMFATEHGVSVSALLDRLGAELLNNPNQDEPIRTRLGAIVLDARKTDAIRRRRRRPPAE